MINYIMADLFDSQDSLVHCVSKDFKMGSGIAKSFKVKYGDVILKEVKNNKGLLSVGISLPVKIKKRYIFNLITKECYWHKPILFDVERCLIDMFKQAKYFRLGIISMPKIGCGLDCLEWLQVKEIIEKHQQNILVRVYFRSKRYEEDENSM